MSLPSVIGYDRARKLSLAGVVAYFFLMLALLVAACVAGGCGGAARVGAAVACPSLLLSIGEAPHLSPERAHADIDSVAAVCRRLQVDADAGTVTP